MLEIIADGTALYQTNISWTAALQYKGHLKRRTMSGVKMFLPNSSSRPMTKKLDTAGSVSTQAEPVVINIRVYPDRIVWPGSGQWLRGKALSSITGILVMK